MINHIWFATGNDHKFSEARDFLVQALPGLQLEQCKGDFPEIQASSLEEVARYKIQAAMDACPGNLFIEDAGLFISCLHGFPGVYSSYVKKTLDCDGILKLLGDKQEKIQRVAYFETCTCVFLEEMQEIHIFKGRIDGHIGFKERGARGFGFDPIFIPDEPAGNELTFAEMTPVQKNAVSHRTRALNHFKQWLLQSHSP
ncbi:RdgB/HAM1 family non-canonical purine NTP pyrophosphatase [Candidatus Bathyarchaeota archaeon]|nr:RdgB/HAM1 family non-canonical purine NTP pyrophosphatase [Candidatus Bathyarchaeota archaeon]